MLEQRRRRCRSPGWAPGRADTRDTGSLAGDLLALIRPWARQLAAKPYGPVITALIAKAQSDPQFAVEYRTRFVQPRRDQAGIIFARAIDRREIPPDTDASHCGQNLA